MTNKQDLFACWIDIGEKQEKGAAVSTVLALVIDAKEKFANLYCLTTLQAIHRSQNSSQMT